MRNQFLICRCESAFALGELLVVLVVVGMLVSLWGASMNRVREKTLVTIDLANLRQILNASAIYSSDNSGYMAHPTWGSDLTGPDGWAYITSNNGRLPGYPNVPPSCAGRDVNSAQFTNQLAFFRKGQVTQYLEDGVKTTWCPKDVAYRERRHGFRASQLWLGRAVKVTSYGWNGTVIGSGRLPAGKTYKVSDFRATDWQMWELDDSDAFNFSDAAVNPESPLVGLMSRRHSGQRDWLSTISVSRRLPGGGVVGTFGGAAEYVRWSKVWDLANRKIAAPNEILNGPEFR